MSINWDKVTCEDVTEPPSIFGSIDTASGDEKIVEWTIRYNDDGSVTVIKLGDASKPAP